jgi:hypothetical protein
MNATKFRSADGIGAGYGLDDREAVVGIPVG